MTVLLINGSPRVKGNTSHMLGWLKEHLEAEGLKVEYYQLGGKDIKALDVEDPVINALCELMLAADGIVIGSPTYYADVSMEVKGAMDRCGIKIGRKLARKAGAAVVMARRGGAIHVYDTINHWFGINNMYTVGSSYWNDGYNRDVTKINEVEEDVEAKKTMKNLAENMAFLIKAIKAQ
ncbi:hypothetical protein EIN_097590 [Entamoeba invadens IP1]|uniref:NADPH-dependent FMN reductase-like domain-containing protein n=1 Tax=Entamoeba invadens IP1 TaxID=370355 RepID=A0A0A1U0R8_ENTIV|nr:hypothetical protein EIN_097590 [Entamoeba invadens IP1]ELP87472.1 hypothetical protein EIN_097590 [Entamoeba invadens IP1]|eukprot:XP_004254243.1 hypothetical protein EIN_097590 [Entamoeba invadens IP1]